MDYYGPMGEQRDAMQSAMLEQRHLSVRGLGCDPGKSAFLTLCTKSAQQRGELSIPDPSLTVAGKPTPEVPRTRILGLTNPKNGPGLHTIALLPRTVSQLVHLVHRDCIECLACKNLLPYALYKLCPSAGHPMVHHIRPSKRPKKVKNEYIALLQAYKTFSCNYESTTPEQRYKRHIASLSLNAVLN